MPDFSITIKGAAELSRALTDQGLLDDLLRPGFEKASVIVQGDAVRNVHKVTRKLAGSLGHVLEGRGANLQARIGPQPGLDQPRGYTESQTSRWKKPRRGVNRGDPRVYAEFEEQGTRHRPGHPFLVPALTDNIDRIGNVIVDEAERAMERRFP